MKSTLLVSLFWGVFSCLYAIKPAQITASADEPAIYDTAVTYVGDNSSSLPKTLPQPGAKLNYTQIMFEHQQITGAEAYIVEVAINEGDNPFNKPLFKQQDSSTATLLSNFSFGKKYVWRYAGLHNGKQLGWNGPFNFEILSNPFADKKIFRVRALINDTLNTTHGLIIMDFASGVVDRNGNFVWFLPSGGSGPQIDFMLQHQSNKLKDLRISPVGTVTFLNSIDAEERDLAGNLLWTAPKHLFGPDSLAPGAHYFYHHCFKRMASGNYMLLDVVRAANPLSGADLSPVVNMDFEALKHVVDHEVIKEFDNNGHLVWNWNSENYFNATELKDLVLHNSGKALANPAPGGHLNAFDVDEKNGYVYAGFRNASRVIKIDKKTGQVLCSWGNNGTYKGAQNGVGFFSKQHGVTLLHDGSLAVFNNNPDAKFVNNKKPVSGAVVFNQPNDSTSKITFEYECRFDSASTDGSVGGNVDELKNGDLLVCMGTVNRVVEINHNKNIVWSSVIEKRDEHDGEWRPYGLHSAHFTSSLYPCYFSVQTYRNTGNNGKAPILLKVFNDGTEDDSYTVDITSSSGNYTNHFSTDILPAKKSLSFEIPSDRVSATEGIKATVTSKTNPGFRRVVMIK